MNAVRCGFLVTIVVLLGCGGNKSVLPTATVSGTITYQGKPLTVGEVIFFHKSGPLEDSEYDEIKKNPQKGKRLIEGVSFLEEVIPLAPYHHEWLIGSGCTARLKHSDIALLGRILAVADVFDALVSDRPDRKGLSVEKALSELEEQAGELFAPDVVESLSRLYASGRLYRAGQIE